jgi:hypothetical protein
MKRLIALAALMAAGFVAGPATAQYYGPGYDRPDYDRPAPRDYGPRRYRDFDDDDDDRPRGRFYGRPDPRFGQTCVTSRGACPTRPAPRNAPCGCEIPGFGFKRGAVN